MLVEGQSQSLLSADGSPNTAPSLQGNCPRARSSTSWAPGEEIKGRDHRESCQLAGVAVKWGRRSSGSGCTCSASLWFPVLRGESRGERGALSLGQATASLGHVGQRATIMAAPCVRQPQFVGL